jgi:hypothetical protein
MSRQFGILLAGPIVLASCAAPAPPTPPITTVTAAPTPTVLADTTALENALALAVPQRDACRPGDAAGWIAAVRATIGTAGITVERAQLVLAVDRNPRRQTLCLLLVQPDAVWRVIGGSKVSTGQAGRRGYFITPTGVFSHSTDIVDYRAEGTFNENHIRGLGVKGMRVWDFGWQAAQKGWTADQEPAEIRLLLHATDPDRLEQRLGRPASKGCVRIPAAMNRFLDHYGVLDAAYERAAATNPRLAEVLPAGREPTPLAGNLMVVIDSSGG